MKIKEITKSVSLKANLGNFQTTDFFCSITVETSQGNEIEDAQKAHEFVVAQITKDRNTSLKYLANLVSQAEKEKLLNTEI